MLGGPKGLGGEAVEKTWCNLMMARDVDTWSRCPGEDGMAFLREPWRDTDLHCG